MAKRALEKAIYLSGTFGNYQVHHNLPGEHIVCHVPTVRIGNAIVRALRELAAEPRTAAQARAARARADWLAD